MIHYTIGKLISIPLFLLVIAAHHLMAQRILETQYFFGNSQHNFVFDKNGRSTYIENRMSVPFGSGGSSVISDQYTGNLLFYTDGVQLFDQSHQLIAGYAVLNGDSSLNQPSAVCPNPAVQGNYFLFTNSADMIYQSEINSQLRGNSPDGNFPYGELISSNIPTPIVNPSEGFTVIEKGDGESYWLIAQNRVTFDFMVFSISPAGFDFSASYNFVTLQTPGFEASHFALSPVEPSIAVSSKTSGRNVILLNFDFDTGELSFQKSLLRTGFSDGDEESVYDVEWSTSGDYLFISRYGDEGKAANLYSYNMVGESLSSILDAPVYRSYGLQRGLDGKVYHLFQENANDSIGMGRITTDDTAILYEDAVFDVSFKGRQFPNFTAPHFTQFNNVGFTYSGVCLGAATKFFPIIDPIPTSYFWDFGDGSTSTQLAPIHTFEDAGGYMVTLTVELNGRTSKHSEFVGISENPLTIDLGADTTICENEVLTLDAGSEGTSFVWSTGETTQTIDIDTTGLYWVAVANSPGGCTAYDQIAVTEYGVERNIAEIWYFGQKAGIDFNADGPVPLTDENRMTSPEGSATATDLDGNLLFYTNGSTVWNKQHQRMVNGSLIGGDSTATQSATIVRVPGDTTLYYIFTTEQVHGDFDYRLKVSMVDMKKDTARGEVVVKDITLMDRSCEKFTATEFLPEDGWLLSHEFGNNSFRLNSITSDGIGNTVYTPLGEQLEEINEDEASGYIRFKPGNTYVANVVPGDNIIDLLPFDASTGILSKGLRIETDENPTNPLYGLEFSSEGSRMYMTTLGNTRKLIQYNLDSLGTEKQLEYITQSKYDGYQTSTDYGSLQIGSDGLIYMAREGSTLLGSISNPGGNQDQVGFQIDGFDLGGRISGLGLPDFVNDPADGLSAPSLEAGPACFGLPIFFKASQTSDIDEFSWTFDEDAAPRSAVTDTVNVLYSTSGLHNVELNITNRCGLDTLLTKEIEVSIIPDDPQVPSADVLCEDQVILEAWPEDDPDLNYYWSTGETSREITVTSSQNIQVAIITDAGCTSDTLDISISVPVDVFIGDDQTVCQETDLPDLDARVVIGSFEWTVNGEATSSTGRFQEVDTDVPGEFLFSLAFTEEITGCISTDSVLITVLENPAMEILSLESSTCGMADATVTWMITSTGSFLYSVDGPVNTPLQNLDGPSLPVTLASHSAGTYVFTIENLITSCTSEVPLAIEDNALWDMQATNLADCGSDSDISIELTQQTPAAVNINIYDDNGQRIRTKENVPVPVADLLDFDTGTYIVEVIEVGGQECIQLDTLQVIEKYERSNFSVDPIQQLCGSRDIATLTPGNNGETTYVWQDSQGEILGSGSEVAIELEGIYTVTADGEELCPQTDTIQINVSPTPTVNIVQEGDLCFAPVSLIADVDIIFQGPFSYLWFFGPGYEEIGLASSILATDPGSYQVQIIDPYIGCKATSLPVSLGCQPRVESPNAFYPASQIEANRTFYVFPNKFIGSFEIYIFNRWGNLVFQSDDLNFKWNGKQDEKDLPMGSYAYVIKFTNTNTPDLGLITQYGGVTLLR